MLLVGEEVYELENRQDRENLHRWVDSWVEDNFEELLMNGELKPELKKVHALISEEDHEGLNGLWFNRKLKIVHWYEPLTGYLDEMNIAYKKLENGDLWVSLRGNHVIFTRDSTKGEPKEDLKGSEETDTEEESEVLTLEELNLKNARYVVSEDGVITREALENLGLSYVKDYYLPNE